MVARRRSKRKATVILPSDDEEYAETTDTVRDPAVKADSKPAKSLRVTDSKASSPSSQKLKVGDSTPSPASKQSRSHPPKTRPIYSFFNAATQRQQSKFEGDSLPKPSPPVTSQEEDLIEDDECAEITQGQPFEEACNARLALAGRKRKIDDVEATPTNGAIVPRSTQRFMKPATRRNDIVSRFADDQRPWTERFAPNDVEELAVHKKKVQTVRSWLDGVMNGHDRKRLLILKGPAGCGKTTTINLLSKEMGLRINEWTNPSSYSSDDGFVSMAAQFEDFVRRASTFGALQFTQTASVIAPSQDDRHPETECQKQVVLLEEFPNYSSRISDGLRAFRTAVLHYLEASLALAHSRSSRHIARAQAAVPIVMIVSESLLSSASEPSDSFSAYRLLGPDILSHSAVTVIEFNPIAPTFMAKALDLILRKEARTSGRRRAPGTAALRHLSEIGDIQSAVSSLQFLSLRGDDDSSDWTGRIAFNSKQKRMIEVPLSTMERNALELITQRESTLDIFHAVGKVLYNKREAPIATDIPRPQPPYHLPQHQRPRAPDANSDDLFNKLGTDTSTFIAALHENYVLSCQGLDREDTIDHVNDCIDKLSDADMLCPDRFNRNQFRHTYSSAATDNLRQEEISFQVSVLGLLFHLPHPVNRLPMPPKLKSGQSETKMDVKSSGFQMLYPASQRLWRKREDLEQMLEVLMRKLRDQESAVVASSPPTRSSPMKPVMSAVEVWRLNRFGQRSSSHPLAAANNIKPGSQGYRTEVASAVKECEEHGNESGPSSKGAMTAMVSKTEMFLERLPIIMRIQKCGRQIFSPSLGLEIEKLARLRGTTESANAYDNEEDADLQSSVGGKKELITLGLSSFGAGRFSFGGSTHFSDATSRGGSTVLADDDIED